MKTFARALIVFVLMSVVGSIAEPLLAQPYRRPPPPPRRVYRRPYYRHHRPARRVYRRGYVR